MAVNSGTSEHWNGTAWTVEPSQGGEAVSCTADNACTAVGSAGTLAARWDGTSWTNQAVPTPSGATAIALTSVSCASASACVAVGTYDSSAVNVVR